MNKSNFLSTFSRQLQYPDSGSGYTSLPTTSLFGTDGIRGKVGELLTASLAYQVGFWAGRVLPINHTQSSPVILGQDSRNSSNGTVRRSDCRRS